ncbi:MAG: ECF-type sigma factor [Planctomycetota bacterium]
MTNQPDEPVESDFANPEAAAELWDAFYERLRATIRQRVREIHRPVASESEVALSAFQSFLHRAQNGQFPDLANQDELWRLLKTIAIRKTNDLRKNLRAQKRGGHQALYNQSDLAGDSTAPPAGVAAAASDDPAPSLDLEVSELFNQLMESLPDDRHRDVILLKLQGASIALIAEHLVTTTRTVQRLLKKIEHQWKIDLLDE